MSRRNVSLFFQTRLPQAVTAQNQHFDQPHREDEAQETPETTEEPTTTTREADADKDQNQSESLDGLISNLKDLLLETLPRREVVADSSSVASPCAGITCIIYDLVRYNLLYICFFIPVYINLLTGNHRTGKDRGKVKVWY